MKKEIKSGTKYGRLKVISEASNKKLPSGQTNRVFLCECDCGNKKEIRMLHLIRNRIMSCGCLKRVVGRKENLHLHKVWKQTIGRCKENYFEKHLYFDKGISVCKEWETNWPEFLAWSMKNGYKIKLQIDRRDNSMGYSPKNCRWVSPKENVNNRDNTFFIEYRGERIAFCILLEKINRMNDYYTIRNRIKRGWIPQKAIDTPIKKGNYHSKSKNIQSLTNPTKAK